MRDWVHFPNIKNEERMLIIVEVLTSMPQCAFMTQCWTQRHLYPYMNKYLHEYRTMKAFLTSALDGGEWWALRSGRFTPKENAPLNRRLGGPQSRPGRGGEEKNFQLLPESNSPITQPVAQRCTAELSRTLKAFQDEPWHSWDSNWRTPEYEFS
jgi:hypothetical protein